MNTMRYELNGAQVLVLDKEVDAVTVNDLRGVLDELSVHQGDVVADLSEVYFIDSSGIGALVFLYKRLIMNGHRLTLICGPGQPRDLLEMLHISKVIPCFESQKAYLQQSTRVAS